MIDVKMIRNQFAQTILGQSYNIAEFWLKIGDRRRRIAWKARGLVQHDRFLDGRE